jgi:hypothetical protein
VAPWLTDNLRELTRFGERTKTSRTGDDRPRFLVHQRVFKLLASGKVQTRRRRHPSHPRRWTGATDKRLGHRLADRPAIEILKNERWRLITRGGNWSGTHHYPSVEIMRVLGGLVDGSPVNREDSPDHVREDEGYHSADDFKVGCPCPGGFWVLAQEPVGERRILWGIAMNVGVDRSEVITRLDAAWCLHLRKLVVDNGTGRGIETSLSIARRYLYQSSIAVALGLGGVAADERLDCRAAVTKRCLRITQARLLPRGAPSAGRPAERVGQPTRRGILTLLTFHSQNVYCASASGMASRSQVIFHLRAEEDAFQPNGHDFTHSHHCTTNL